MQPERGTMGRRGFLGLLAVTTIAGCAGGGSSNEGTPTSTDTPADGMPTGTSGTPGETSLAGSCASAFGDTDQRYDPGDRGLVATFAYPMAGTIYEESTEGMEILTSIGYGENDYDEYRHRLRVFQRGPVEYDVVETYTSADDWVEGEPVTYDGAELPVAELDSDTTAAKFFGIEGPDGTYELEVRVGANIGDPCPDVYANICDRVANSFEPVSQ